MTFVVDWAQRTNYLYLSIYLSLMVVEFLQNFARMFICCYGFCNVCTPATHRTLFGV